MISFSFSLYKILNLSEKILFLRKFFFVFKQGFPDS